MMSQIRSRIEYIIPANNIVVLLLHLNFILKSLMTGFQYDLMII